MDWYSALENASEYWDSTFPNLDNLCMNEVSRPASVSSLSEIQLNPLALSLEPRSISSSELDESSTASRSSRFGWTPEEDDALERLVKKHRHK